MTAAVADAPPIDAGRPGTLTVRTRAVERLVHGVIGGVPLGDADPHVEILSLDDEGVELRATISLGYRPEPLSVTLTSIRRLIANEVARQLGRPVRRVDFVVESFDLEPPAPARRVI